MYLRVLSRGTCYCPTRLDFHPYTQARPSDLQNQQRFDPPPIFQRASIWPGIDRRASGPPPLTPSEHTSSLTVNCCGLVGFPSATRINRLTSPMIKTPWEHFSKRTTGRCSYHRFHAQSACTQLVSRSFHIPLRILFNFHSLLVNYRSRAYLGLEVSASHIHTRFPTHATL